MIPPICMEIVSNAMHGTVRKVEGAVLSGMSTRVNPEVMKYLCIKILWWWKPNVFSTASDHLELSNKGIDRDILGALTNNVEFNEIFRADGTRIYFADALDTETRSEILTYADANFKSTIRFTVDPRKVLGKE